MLNADLSREYQAIIAYVVYSQVLKGAQYMNIASQLDFGSWGPMILGHAFPPVVEAIARAARNSASFGASTAAEGELAERIVVSYPVMEKMRFDELRHRSHHVGDSRGARCDQPQNHY